MATIAEINSLYAKDAVVLSDLAYGPGTSTISTLVSNALGGLGWQAVMLSGPGLVFDSEEFVNAGPGLRAFVAYNSISRTAALVFRGTDRLDLNAWLADFQGVTDGWGTVLDNFDELIQAFNSYVAKPENHVDAVLATGHSLGAALAEQFLAENIHSNYFGVTFASPGIQSAVPALRNTLIKYGNMADPVYDITPDSFQNGAIYKIFRADVIDGIPEHALGTYRDAVNLVVESPLFNEFQAFGIRNIVVSTKTVTVSGSNVSRFMVGGTLTQVYNGGTLLDLLDGGGGADFLYGGGGGDQLMGGPGDDHLYGQDGDDFFDFGKGFLGNDTMYGGPGNDEFGGVGVDVIDGGTGDDFIQYDSYATPGKAWNLNLRLEVNKQQVLSDGAKFINVEAVSFRTSSGNDTMVIGGLPTSQPHLNLDWVGGAGYDQVTLDFSNFNGSIHTAGGWTVDLISYFTEIATYVRDGYFFFAEVEKFVVLGGSAGDQIVGLGGNDLLVGYDGADTLIGQGGNDSLKGFIGGDSLSGGAGIDTLQGGPGKDTLVGGGDGDLFLFDNALGLSNIDTIRDFSSVADTIRLSRGIFDGLGAVGTLAKSLYVAGPPNHISGVRIIYDKSTGGLYYNDADGVLQFAILSNRPASLSYQDFVLY